MDNNRLLKQLTEIYQTTNDLRSKEENICSNARRLLIPWPKKKTRHTEEQNEENKKEQSDGKQVAPTAPEVLLVEKALVKAQKTRNKLNAKLSVELSQVNESIPHPQNAVPDCTQMQTETKSSNEAVMRLDTGFENVETNSYNDVLSSDHDHIRSMETNSSVAIISQTKLKQVLSASNAAKGPYSKYQSVRSERDSNKQTTTSKSSSAAGNAFTPAHLSAPFQTKTVVKKLKPGQTRTQMLRASANSTKPSTKGGTLSQRHSLARIGSGNQGVSGPSNSAKARIAGHSKALSRDTTQKEYSSHSPESARLGNQKNKEGDSSTRRTAAQSPHISSSGARSNTVEVRHGQVLAKNIDVDTLEKRLKNVHVAHPHENMNNNANTNTDEALSGGQKQEEPFDLQRDGKKLSVPPKFAKLLSNNRRMREKLKSVSITKKAQENASAAECFMTKMDSYFAQGFSGDQYWKLMKMRAHCDTYQQLAATFKDICNMSLKDSSHYKEVLMGKRGMEHVLRNFAEMEEEFQSLCSDFHINISREEIPALEKEDSSKLFWLPASFIPDSLSFTTKMKYHSRKQMLEYTTLVHQIQVLLLQKFIIDESAKELLPVLHNKSKKNQHDREAVELYRGAYSLLCCNGATFPVMVHDEDGSNDDEVNDETEDDLHNF